MIKVSTKFNMAIPNFDMTTELETIAERIFIPSMQAGIDIRAAIDGTQLPHNEEATIKRKGHDRPLIETGNLRSAFLKIPLGKNKVKVTLASVRKNIGEYLQFDGVRTKSGMKYYRFFGINPTMEQSAINFLKSKIKERIHGRAK